MSESAIFSLQGDQLLLPDTFFWLKDQPMVWDSLSRLSNKVLGRKQKDCCNRENDAAARKKFELHFARVIQGHKSTPKLKIRQLEVVIISGILRGLCRV